LNVPRHQRGIALMTAIILVALATVLAVSIGFATAMTARRGVAGFTVEQGLQFGAAAEAFAAEALKDDAGQRVGGGGGGGQQGQQDHPAESWTTRRGPIEIAPDVALEGQLEDESGKFNLNTLVNGQGEIDPQSLEIFTRLLEQLGLEPTWAQMTADWIDPDSTIGTAEDNLYTVQRPGYRTANTYITSPSELMALPEFGRERYLRLLPHITALPPEARAINTCFATPELLDALEGAFTQNRSDTWTRDREALAEDRKLGCRPQARVIIDTASTAVRADNDKFTALQEKVAEQSTYFRLHTWVSIGTTRFALYSLLQRQGQQVSLVYRTFGTE
jgi:general secretion pathway protein K